MEAIEKYQARVPFEVALVTYAKSLLVSAFCFGMLSAVTAYFCVLFAGAGHAALSPYAVFFGPIYMVINFFLPNNVQGATYADGAVKLMFVFYCLYLIPLWIGRMLGYGRPVLIVVLMFHYACVAACTRSMNWDGIDNFWMVNDAYGSWISLFLVELFFLLHLMAYQYATSDIPFRLRVTRGTVLLLALGLAVGFVFLAVTNMVAPR